MAQFALNARYLHNELEAARKANAEEIAYDWTEHENWRPDYPALLKSAFPGQNSVMDRHWNGG